MRLTKKKDSEYSIIAYDTDLIKCGDDAINKLGQLEDIEDELGIDLITLFNEIKDTRIEEFIREIIAAIKRRKENEKLN